MDWQQVTQSFLPLSREQTTPFATPREMDLAISTYNRAIRNLNQDSADIALIALRKLAVDYPRFHEASLLYGCCLARDGELEEARQQLLNTQQLPELPSDLAEATVAALGLVEADLAIAAQPPQRQSFTDARAEQMAAADLPSGKAPVVLERTGRSKRVRMASERERREVMRQGDMPRQEETHVVMPRTTIEIVRSVIPVALIVLAAALVIFLGIRYLPGLFNRNSGNGAQERLDYLLSRLEQKAPQDPELQALLTDYSQRFAPAATTVPSASTTSPATTATPTIPIATTGATTPTVTESAPAATTASTIAPTAAGTTPASSSTAPSASAIQPTDAAAALLSANALFQNGQAAKATDIVRAAELFNQAISQLTAIPPQTTATGYSLTAGQLLTQARAEFDSISKNAALKLRSDAQALFDSQQVAAAMPLYLRAYAIDPNSYGGGVAYYCGRCYQILGQPDQARPYYQYVIDHFAGRDIAVSAASRLREIGG